MLAAHSWQFKYGSTNFFFQQQEYLWHLSFCTCQSWSWTPYRFWGQWRSNDITSVIKILVFRDLKQKFGFMENNWKCFANFPQGLYDITLSHKCFGYVHPDILDSLLVALKLVQDLDSSTTWSSAFTTFLHRTDSTCIITFLKSSISF